MHLVLGLKTHFLLSYELPKCAGGVKFGHGSAELPIVLKGLNHMDLDALYIDLNVVEIELDTSQCDACMVINGIDQLT